MVKYQTGTDILSRIPVEHLSPTRIGPKPIQIVKGETLHPFLSGAIFNLWQVPGEEQVWVNQDSACRPKYQGARFLTGFLATSVLMVGAYLALQGEYLKQEAEEAVLTS